MKRRIGLHILFWLAYWLLYAYIYSRYDGHLFKYLFTEGVQMPARIVTTYAVIFLFERLSNGQLLMTWLVFTGAAAANILGGMFNRILKLYWLVPDYFPDSTIKYWDYRMVYDIFDCVLASCIALSIRMYFRYQEQQKREAALLLEKSAAELRALRSQIQPHFLFNTINNLYVLARNKSDKTAPLALKLAGLLRYVLYESADKTVSISKEIALIKDYVDMEQLRFDEDRLRLTLNTQIDNPEQSVAPLLLLPLVENAFKHGASEQADEAQIRIDIILKNGQLDVRVENSCTETPTGQPVGIGLENLRRQLELLYPAQYDFSVQRQQRLFIAHLQIEL